MITSELRSQLIQKTLENISDEPLTSTIEKQLKVFLPSADENYTKERDFLINEIEGYGPIENLLKDPQVTEILVNSYQEIYFEKNGELHPSDEIFSSPITLERLVKKFLSEMDRVADRRYPLVDGTLKDGTRVHVALPPITQAPVLSIRRHGHRSWTLENLCEQKMFSTNVYQKLVHQISQRKTILICGPTGSGKTTLMRALLKEVSLGERIVTIEDTEELCLKRSNTVSLLTRICLDDLVPSVTLNDLLKNALRMRPDRLVIGEIRGEEALIFLDAISTGHSGSMSSIHGSTTQQALSRLEQLVSRAAPQWSVASIRKLIFESVSSVICVERKKEGRAISEIADLTGLENFGFLIEPWCLD
jgi:pilus assembly protein CpaF